MARIGSFIFKASGVSFSQITRANRYNYQVHRTIDSHILTPKEDSEKITIKGELYSEFHNLSGFSLEDLRKEASKRKPLDLAFTDITKTQLKGRYVISQIKQDSDLFQSDGAPLRSTFTLELIRYGD